MTDFIYRKENALSFDFCRSLIELFEIDKERQHRGVIRKGEEIIPVDDQKTSTDVSFIPPDIEDKLWGKSLRQITKTVEQARQDWITQYHMGLERLDPFEICFSFNMQRFLPGEGFMPFIVRELVGLLVIGLVFG